MTKEEERRFDALVESLSTRLGPVCDNWPSDLFDEMIRRLAEITLKYEGDDGSATYDRRGTDRLINEMKELLERNQQLRAPPATPPLPTIRPDDRIPES